MIRLKAPLNDGQLRQYHSTSFEKAISETSHPFEIRTLDWISRNRPEQWRVPKRSGFFEMVWIKRASGTYTIDLEKHQLADNTFYCIDPGQLQVLQVSDDISGYYISFSPQFLCFPWESIRPISQHPGLCRYGMARVIQVDIELAFELEEIMGQMVREYSNYSLLRQDILVGILKILMIYLTRSSSGKEPKMIGNKNGDLVRRFMVLLENSVTQKKTVYTYARELGISANYLNDIVKRTTGHSASHHIQQTKILEAKRQLIYYGKSMKEIAYYLGFDDTTHFSKFFKTNAGVGFQNFRKDLQERYYE